MKIFQRKLQCKVFIQSQCLLFHIALRYLSPSQTKTYLPGEPSCGERASPGGGVFQPGWRGRRRHTVWQHGTAARQEAAQSYTHPLYTLASSSLPEGCRGIRNSWGQNEQESRIESSKESHTLSLNKTISFRHGQMHRYGFWMKTITI